jgi:hypothetical protein
MNRGDLVKIILSQGIITIFAVALGYVKLKQEIAQTKTEKVYELALERLRKQLCDFYGPLFMLTTSTSQIAITAWGTDIWEEVWREIIVPSHLQIENILLTRIDLLDEDEVPESYLLFLKHAKVNRSYLKRGLGASYFEKETPYPIEFNKDILGTYERKRREYLQLLKSI